MANNNFEHQFISKDLDAYKGMKVEEYVFCRLKNYHGEMQEYKLDFITLPDDIVSPRPVVIFIHGGGFVQPYNRRQAYIPIFAKSLTQAGYTVVSPDYPIFDDIVQRSMWNETLGADRAAEAAHLAYLYIKENADALKVDVERIALMGGSAGGMTGFYLLEHYDDDFKLFANCWGPPMHVIPDVSKFPPTISIHGTADETVPYELEIPIQSSFEDQGIPHKLITLENEGHTPMNRFSEFIPTLLEWLDKYMNV